ncbi:hypothetical protein N0V82_005272 [Gnomoniopsis sp. IMI 355080]|nr:hypothetical protein N0V82_005272 [Gnomoniopsis sp. IMI 355080]
MPNAWFLITLTLVFLAGYALSKIGRRPPDCPPGPPTLPIIGNLHQIPTKDPYLQFEKWAQEYGEIYSLMLGTTVLIVLSSDNVVKELMVKRSGIYSSRPDMEILRDLSGGNTRVTFMPYGEEWRLVRKIYHNTLDVKAADSYVPYQDLESKHLLAGFLEAPDSFEDHLKRYTHSQTTQIVFGFRIISIHDPNLKQFFESFEQVVVATQATSAALLDLFPILRRLPEICLPMKRRAKRLHKAEELLYGGHWSRAKAKVEQGKLKSCFSVDLCKAQKEYGFSDKLASYIAGVQLEGGTDSSVATLLGFVLAMLLFPDVQKTAQRELDRVCGSRLPTMQDEESLPYIRGCVKETLRWFPTAVLGLPHATTRNDEYQGYHIPKDATVLMNVWTLHQNPDRYPEPTEFNPLRFINDKQTSSEAAMNSDISQRDHFMFGIGRRICPGMNIADRSLFLAISRLLWAFRFEKALDEDGKEIVPEARAVTQASLVQPLPFPVKIIPRSDMHAEMIKTQWKESQDLLDEEGQWLSPAHSL